MNGVTKFIATHRKAVVAVVGAVVTIVGVQLGVNSSVYDAIVAIATALGVYGVPNQGA